MAGYHHLSEPHTFIDTQYAREPLITSVPAPATAAPEYLMISLYPDAGQSTLKRFRAETVQRTIVSRTDEVEYPHAFAVREAVRSLKFLHLQSAELRQPGSLKAPTVLSPEGSNLPTMLARMQAEDHLTLTDVARDLADLVPDVVNVDLKKDTWQHTYTIQVHFEDRRAFPASVLSNGTLLLLALAALRNDPQFRGVLCLQEPENSVYPLSLQKIRTSIAPDGHQLQRS